MVASRDHILALPKAMLGLRILQLCVAVACLGLGAYGVTFIVFDGDCLMLFTAIATMIITVYYIVASTGAPVLYNYWAILGLDIFAIIFWLISFALLASEIAPYFGSYYNNTSSCTYYYGYCIKKRSVELEKRYTYTNVITYRNALAAASGLGGLNFLLFIITLAFSAVYLHRHRQAGGHCMPGKMATAPMTAEHKDVEQQPRGYNGQPPAAYPQQGYTNGAPPAAVYQQPQQQYQQPVATS